MQVLVDTKDRPFLRFLWRNNNTMSDYEYTSHIFGATDSPCFACYAVQHCATDNTDVHPDITAIVQRNIYMNDLYLALPTDEEATDTAQNLRTVLSTGFNLTKWRSNNRNFLKAFYSELRAAGADPEISLTPQRDLGMPWDPEDVYFITPDRTTTEKSKTYKHPLNAVY